MKNKNRLNNGEVITLKSSEMTDLEDLDIKIAQKKCLLADLYIKLQRATVEVENLNKEFLDEAKKIALAHGIDVNDPATGQWDLNIKQKTLSKI
jgi:hypothetical protein